MITYEVTNQWMDLATLDELVKNPSHITLSPEVKRRISDCRSYLDRVVAKNDRSIYGINTGFGSLCDTAIAAEDIEQLQRNLVLSHASGAGERVPERLVRRMLLLKVLGLSHGNSGVQLETVERLLFFFNNEIYPVVYQQGSLGASGDLAPLAHLSLPLLGEGEVVINGNICPSSEYLKRYNLTPITLRSKEGLALLNGTQFMSAYASDAVSQSIRLFTQFNWTAALSLEGYDGRPEPFGVEVNAIRNQLGQIEVAKTMRGLLEGSELITREKTHVQDPYSFRCIPQVHGASLDTINHCAQIIEREINAVTDNPTIFPEDDLVVSAGNFHGQPLALAMDFLAIALAELGSISERRVYKSIAGNRELPAFLVANPGLNSGLMITQYTCASIVSQNKQLCTPASIDTIDSSNGQEDHVSMGANAATKLMRVVENCWTIQGIELLHATQAFEFRRPLKSSIPLEKMYAAYREHIPFISEDQYLHPFIVKSTQFVKENLWKIIAN